MTYIQIVLWAVAGHAVLSAVGNFWRGTTAKGSKTNFVVAGVAILVAVTFIKLAI